MERWASLQVLHICTDRPLLDLPRFAGSISFTGATVTAGTGTVAGISGSDTSEVTVNLTGVGNAQTITLTLSGVNDGANTGDVDVRLGVLAGDITANEAVNSSDVVQAKAQSGHAVTAANFRSDVSANGSINSSDISLVKSRSGTALPQEESSGARRWSAWRPSTAQLTIKYDRALKNLDFE